MTELIVMAKDGGTMNVPPGKVQEYLEAGWIEIERVPMSDSVPSAVPPKAVSKAEKPNSKAKE